MIAKKINLLDILILKIMYHNIYEQIPLCPLLGSCGVMCDGYLVTKLSASRSSTVCLSMFGGTNSRPFLAQRVARLGDRIWHTQRFGQICARTAMATASITHSNSLSMVTTPPGLDTWKRRRRETKRERNGDFKDIGLFLWQLNAY